jgi:hypothetical protein
MDLLSKAELRALIAERAGPCISIYLPTHRTGPETRQDPIRFKNLLKQAEERLHAGGVKRGEVEKVLARLWGLQKEEGFWRYRGDGLAVFASPENFRYFRLPFQFSELVVSAERFHIKPLLALMTVDGQFYVLALSQKQVRLLQGTRQSVGELDLENVPKSLRDALGLEEKEKQLQFHTAARGASAIFHGQGSAGDETDHKKDLLRYFRAINRGLCELLGAERVPLVLAGVDYLLPIYREANSCAELVGEAIIGNPEGLTAAELHTRAWAILEPHFRREQEAAAAHYRALAGTGRASGDLNEIVSAAHHGRIESLFVAVGVERWGKFEEGGARLEMHDRRQPGDEDLLDLAAAQTLIHQGRVYAVSPAELPAGGAASPVAAVFRY